MKMNLSIIKKLIFYTFITWIIYFFWKTIYSNFTNILEYNFSFNIYYILASIFIVIIVVFYWAVLWKHITKKSDIKYSDIFYIQGISWLAKYLPWKAGIVLSKIYFLTKHWVNKKRWLVSSIYENIFQILSAFLVSIPVVLYYFAWWISNYYLYFSILFVIWFLVFIYPPVFYFFINFWLKLFKKEILEKKYFLDEFEILKNLFLYSIWIILNWIAFFLMIKWITNISWNLLLPIIWIWNFAWVIWLLAIFAPAWLWVREGILILFLWYYFPVEIASLIAVFSRFWTTICDGIIWIYVLVCKSLKWKK